MNQAYDIAIIGAGPGGYVAAVRAAQMRKRVALIERDRMGGTCMNWGCIPTKFLLHQTQTLAAAHDLKTLDSPIRQIRLNWELVQNEKQVSVDRLVKGIEFLVKRNGVDLIRGDARLLPGKRISLGDDHREISANRVILATGSRPLELPFLQPDGRHILTSRDALGLSEVPESMLIIGAGAIGLEMGTIYNRLGCRVTILEILPQILPGSDPAVTKRLERLLKRQGLQVLTRMRVESSRNEGGEVVLKGVCLKDDNPFEYRAEKVLLAAGRRPVSESLNETEGIELDGAGFVRVDERLETGATGIFAIGDLIGGKLLAHKASHEGLIAVENAFGREKRLNSEALPLAVFTEPEFASVGLTEEETEQRYGSARSGVFPLQASGRALTMGGPEGMVKIVADGEERIRGAHILAPHASEMIPELTLAVTKGLTLEDVGDSVHIHPTLSESIMEAALKARGRAIHILN